MKDNVVLFPREKRGSPPQTIEELRENVENTRREHVEYIVDEMLSFVFARCYEDGFDLNSDHCLKSTAMLVESFRAALLGSVGVEHPLHDIADNMFVHEEDIETLLENIHPDEYINDEEPQD